MDFFRNTRQFQPKVSNAPKHNAEETTKNYLPSVQPLVPKQSENNTNRQSKYEDKKRKLQFLPNLFITSQIENLGETSQTNADSINTNPAEPIHQSTIHSHNDEQKNVESSKPDDIDQPGVNTQPDAENKALFSAHISSTIKTTCKDYKFNLFGSNSQSVNKSSARLNYEKDTFNYALNFGLSITTSSHYVWVQDTKPFLKGGVQVNNGKLQLALQSLSNHLARCTVSQEKKLVVSDNQLFTDILNQNHTEQSEFKDLLKLVTNLCNVYNIRSFGFHVNNIIQNKMVELFLINQNKKIGDFKVSVDVVSSKISYDMIFAVCKNENSKYFLIAKDSLRSTFRALSAENVSIDNYSVVLVAYKRRLK